MSIITLNAAYYGEYRSNNTFNEVGKTVTFQADIYTNYDCRIYIYTYVEGYTFNFATIPINTPGTYSVTRTIPENAIIILYCVVTRDYSHADAFVYTDNWRLIIQ